MKIIREIHLILKRSFQSIKWQYHFLAYFKTLLRQHIYIMFIYAFLCLQPVESAYFSIKADKATDQPNISNKFGIKKQSNIKHITPSVSYSDVKQYYKEPVEPVKIESQFTANTHTAKTGDIINYRLVLTNDSFINAKTVSFKNTFSSAINFVVNSLQINGNTISGVTNITDSYIQVGDINVGHYVVITFQGSVADASSDLTSICQFRYYSEYNNTLELPGQTNMLTILGDQLDSSNPLNFKGEIEKYRFLNKIRYLLKMTWQAPSSNHVTVYHIYYKRKCIAKIPAHHRRSYKKYIANARAAKYYSIAAYDHSGKRSELVSIDVSDR